MSWRTSSARNPNRLMNRPCLLRSYPFNQGRLVYPPRGSPIATTKMSSDLFPPLRRLGLFPCPVQGRKYSSPLRNFKLLRRQTYRFLSGFSTYEVIRNALGAHYWPTPQFQFVGLRFKLDQRFPHRIDLPPRVLDIVVRRMMHQQTEFLAVY